MRQTSFHSIQWVTALLVAGSFASVSQAQEANADLQAIGKMAKQGQRPAALARLTSYLTQHPKDLSARFMKGVLLVEQAEQSRPKDSKEARDPNRYREAISVFYSIIKDNPDHPEPYNNLAAIYASLDQWDKSKEMLEAAIKTNPSYATAHENLGDVYAKLASQAYEKALQLDTTSPVVQNKLKMISDIFPQGGHAPQSSNAKRPSPVASPSAVAVASPSSGRSTTGAFKPTAVPSGTAVPQVVAAAAKNAVKNLKQPVASADEEETTDEAPAQSNVRHAAGPDEAAVLGVVQGWAGAWSKQDVQSYLGYYADNFKPSSGQSRELWKKHREARITRPKSIKVDVVNAKVNAKGDEAQVTFKQTYHSDIVGRDSMVKRLTLIKENGQWRIIRESGR
jgi:ketosteroid isomerase-like protein